MCAWAVGLYVPYVWVVALFRNSPFVVRFDHTSPSEGARPVLLSAVVVDLVVEMFRAERTGLF